MINLRKIISTLLIFDFLALTLLGKGYSKLQILEFGLYAHDLLLIILALICILKFNWKQNRVYAIELILAISIVYVLVSLWKIDFNFTSPKIFYIIRQYAIVGYFGIFYVITKFLFEEKKFLKVWLNLIFLLSVGCFLIQLLNIIYLYFCSDRIIYLTKNAFSPIISLGLIVINSAILASNRYDRKIKLFSSLITFLISISIHHDSLYLALFIIWALYFFIHLSKNKKKFSVIVSIILVGLLFVLLPSFNDVNAHWRLIYWQAVVEQIVENYFILGDGFGIQYISDKTIEKLNQLMISKGHINTLITEGEKYTTGAHNSFLSFAQHLGAVSVFLLFYPLIIRIKDLKIRDNTDLIFLILSISGMSVFSFFNVLLELPHSSSLYWLVFFALIYYNKNTKIENI
ncbi:MAG: hypothetical protein O2906_04990 [Bacteroidetes bacterium]|nr:hypothetical protein [Bacteroidota bacterium]MDA0860312.1 hypothetical protein [Bacteroidota bacterium]MDA1318520.1 hypothetical protein [Bacteroidota bacterium]